MVKSLPARPRHRSNLLILQVNGANLMVLAVGDIERLPNQAQSLWIVELRFGICAVQLSGHAGADSRQMLSGQISDHDAMMRTIGDEEAIASFVGEHASGEIERARLG